MNLKVKVKDQIIHIFLEGTLNDDRAEEFTKWADQVHQTILDVQKETRSQVRILTDASRVKSVSKKIMGIYNDLLKKDFPFVYKSATFGSKTDVMATLATLSITSDRSNFQQFRTKEEALRWLMQ